MDTNFLRNIQPLRKSDKERIKNVRLALDKEFDEESDYESDNDDAVLTDNKNKAIAVSSSRKDNVNFLEISW